MLRALIVDDERLARVALKALLATRADVEVVGEAASVEAAKEQLRTLQPDLIFLDVQMPGASGFELLKEPLSARVIFCTAYEHYAVRAFEVNALDYLVKPVNPQHLERALSRATPLTAPMTPLRADDVVSLKEANTMRLVPMNSIVHIEAADDYSEVHLHEGPPALVDVTLREWETRLPEEVFVRIHRSSLVNVRFIEKLALEDGQWRLSLRGGKTLEVSRRLAPDVKRRLVP